MNITTGHKVKIAARVTHLFAPNHLPVEMHAVEVQLSDGQRVTTNVRNLEFLPTEPVAPDVPDFVSTEELLGEIAQQRAEAEAALAKLTTATTEAAVKRARKKKAD